MVFELEPAESLLLVFSREGGGESYPVGREERKDPKYIVGPWAVSLYKADGTTEKAKFEGLYDLSKSEQYKSFGGRIEYETSYAGTEKSSGYNYLDMGNVNGITRLWINGEMIGMRWYGRHKYEISGKLRSGENQIKIEVITVLGNYTRSLADNKIAQTWTRNHVVSGGLSGY